MYFRLLMTLFCACAFSLTSLMADESAGEPTDKQIADWVKQLDADEFADREEATGALRDAGPAAIDSLVEAAQGESREVTIRALDVLQHLASGDDDGVKKQANDALQKLAESDHEAAARGAKAAIESANQKPVEEPKARPFGPGRVIIGGRGGVARIEMRAIGGGKGMRISRKEVDGNKEIEAVEGDRTVKITESAEGKIEMEVTEKKDGEEEVKKYEAKDAEELKTVHPEAHKLYKKYSGGGFGRIEIKPFRIEGALPRPVPALPRALPALPDDERFDEVRRRLEEARIEMEAREKDHRERIERLLEGREVTELEKAQRQIERAMKHLEAQDGDHGERVSRALEQLKKVQAEIEALQKPEADAEPME